MVKWIKLPSYAVPLDYSLLITKESELTLFPPYNTHFLVSNYSPFTSWTGAVISVGGGGITGSRIRSYLVYIERQSTWRAPGIHPNAFRIGHCPIEVIDEPGVCGG